MNIDLKYYITIILTFAIGVICGEFIFKYIQIGWGKAFINVDQGIYSDRAKQMDINSNNIISLIYQEVDIIKHDTYFRDKKMNI